MAFNRNRLLTLAATRTVETMHTAVEELANVELQPSLDGVSQEVDTWLEEIKEVEHAETLAKAAELFPDLVKATVATAVQAGASKEDATKEGQRVALGQVRLLSRRAGEARILAAWLIAEANGASNDTCEAYRKASALRTSMDTVEADLEELCAATGKALIPCSYGKNGRPSATKASAPAIMALINLRHARKLCRSVKALKESVRDTAKAASAAA